MKLVYFQIHLQHKIKIHLLLLILDFLFYHFYLLMHVIYMLLIIIHLILEIEIEIRNEFDIYLPILQGSTKLYNSFGVKIGNLINSKISDKFFFIKIINSSLFV